MAYEVDYLQVGEGERSGDAIAIRYGNLTGPREQQVVIVIDGGDKDAGERLVQHIASYYKTDLADLVISTHPDQDHASGLTVVMEKMRVGALLMHKPWEHAQKIKDAFTDGRWTGKGLGESVEKSLRHASELQEIAERKKVRIVEPFEGVGLPDGSIRVLGPSLEYYLQLLPHFDSTPDTKLAGLLGSLVQKTKDEVQWIADSLDLDLLTDDEDTTRPENNSSVVLLLTLDGHKLLFTGDAGKTALLRAADYAARQGISLVGMNFLDVPHHGSKRNLSSKVLKRINASTAFISASSGSPKHPAKKIINGLQKHGAKVYVTPGNTLLHHNNGVPRGWGDATPQPFHAQVEA